MKANFTLDKLTFFNLARENFGGNFQVQMKKCITKMKMIYFKLLFVHTETELLNVVKELLKNVKNATLL